MNKRLGRGLEALISTGQESIDKNTGIATIKIGNIHPNPYQPRHVFDEEKLNELANSLAESGMIQPIIVTKNSKSEYELIAGERRLEAAKIAGFNEVPVIIRCVSPREQLQFALIENIQRENLNPIEEAKAYQQLQEQFNLTHQDIAKLMGKERVTVTNTVRLLKLDSKVQNFISSGKISPGHGRALLQLDIKDQSNYADMVIKRNYSVRETEHWLRRLSNKEDKNNNDPEENKERKSYLSYIQHQIGEKLSMPVKVEEGKKGGKISIHYRSEEELQKLFSTFIPGKKL